MTGSGSVNALFTDLYELTMAAAYFAHDMHAPATFSVFARDPDRKRPYFMFAGLEPLLEALATFRFGDGDIAYLQETGRFPAPFLDFLARLRFSGSVRSMAEGTLFFAGEPVLEITAPVIEAQLVETLVLNMLNVHTLTATKAARCIAAAGGRPLVDFSLRRTHGYDAGMAVARSAYIAGFEATSNVLAGKTYGIPISGTMAHSFITAFGNETDAFNAYADTFPGATVLLIDTYDVEQGARNAVVTARRLRERGSELVGVRLDSGDMVEQSRRVRQILDAAGLTAVRIFASSGFDEFKIHDTIRAGGCIDAFGVGTHMGVSADAPFMDIVYKMVCYDNRDVKKKSTGKPMLAGAKQVFRTTSASGRLAGDMIGHRDETMADAEALLATVMENGRQTHPAPSLQHIREYAANRFEQLPDVHKRLHEPVPYPVSVSRTLADRQ